MKDILTRQTQGFNSVLWAMVSISMSRLTLRVEEVRAQGRALGHGATDVFFVTSRAPGKPAKYRSPAMF